MVGWVAHVISVSALVLLDLTLGLWTKPAGPVSHNDHAGPGRFLSLALALYGINMRVRNWGLA